MTEGSGVALLQHLSGKTVILHDEDGCSLQAAFNGTNWELASTDVLGFDEALRSATFPNTQPWSTVIYLVISLCRAACAVSEVTMQNAVMLD
jgi:hypothetical protein